MRFNVPVFPVCGTCVPALLLSLLLTACGGGGGGGNGSALPTANAAGVWQGLSTSGFTVDLVVLPNNQFVTVFGTSVNGALNVAGFDVGSGMVSGSTLSGALTEFNNAGQRYTGNVNANVITGQSLTGSTAYAGGTTTSFSLTPLSGGYVYNTPANLASVSGTFNGTLLNGAAASVTINGNGVLTGNSGSCTFSGTAMPEPSNVNVFDVTLTFGASPCNLPGQTLTGYGLSYPTTAGTTQLIVALTSAGSANGTLFLAQR